jgi:hypothetical protein
MTIQKYVFLLIGALLVVGFITSPSPSGPLREASADEANSLIGGACPTYFLAHCTAQSGVTPTGGCPLNQYYQVSSGGAQAQSNGVTYCGIYSTCTPTPLVGGLTVGCGG